MSLQETKLQNQDLHLSRTPDLGKRPIFIAAGSLNLLVVTLHISGPSAPTRQLGTCQYRHLSKENITEVLHTLGGEGNAGRKGQEQVGGVTSHRGPS